MSQSGRSVVGSMNPIDTLTGNTGGAVGPTAGNINILGTGSISVAGNPGTSTLTISSTALTSISITGDSGGAQTGSAFTFTGGSIGLTFAGAADTFTLGGTLVVSNGGTGDSSFTAYAPVCGGTTTTAHLQSASTGMSNSGYILTSTGSASLPTWQAAPVSGITTIDGDTGSVTGSTIKFDAVSQAGSSVSFSGSGTTMSLNVTDANTNTIIGSTAGNSSISGINNTGLGYASLLNLSSGSSNTGVGVNSLVNAFTSSNNTAVGENAGGEALAGDNTLIGYQAGLQYQFGIESSNICIGSSVQGTAGESHVLRIGNGTGTSQGQLSKAFISGIQGVNVGSVASVVSIASSGDQLGSTTITAGTGISITPGANTITIAATFVDFPFTDKSTSFSAASNNGYFVTGTSTATMPASPSQGDKIEFIVDTASTLTVTANTGQTLRIGSSLSASAGTAANNARGDAVTFIYRSADTEWLALSVIGTWTVT